MLNVVCEEVSCEEVICEEDVDEVVEEVVGGIIEEGVEEDLCDEGGGAGVELDLGGSTFRQLMYQPDVRPKDGDLPLLVVGTVVDLDLGNAVLGLGLWVGDVSDFALPLVLVFGLPVVFTCVVVVGGSLNVVKPMISPSPSELAVIKTVSTSVTCLFSWMRRWASRRMLPERRWCPWESILFVFF